MSAELVLFWVFSFCVVASSVMVVLAKSPITCAMSLVASFFFLAGIYVLLWAHTLAVLQVLVYAGAIMVLFLFVIMLLSLTEPGPSSKVTLSRLAGSAATIVLLVTLIRVFRKLPDTTAPWTQQMLNEFGGLKGFGDMLYKVYLLPFEAVSLLLLVAVVGAVVVAKSKI